ncbi:MAG: GTP 3',8-cyclase MoaA [Bacillota bacterium]|nr:GTP 3',8-cyclase MoaA [Bacillota bacterium]
MTDGYGRKIEYLRMSVTDACNLNCSYCMPEEGSFRCNCNNNLTVDEFAEIVTAAAELGIKKLRITGGEPLVRRDIVELVRRMSEIKGIEDISMTTNATLLAPAARDLYEAGIRRINISLDTTDTEKYARITRGGRLTDAIEGIRAALAAGMNPVKLNAVLMGGINDDEIEDLARLTVDYPVELRFIELMPIGNTRALSKDAYVPSSLVLERLPELEKIDSEKHSVAKLYRLPGAKGKIGLISPLSNHFCGECNRLRLTADGCLKPCLHSADEISVRGLHGAELKEKILFAVNKKPRMHGELSTTSPSESKRSMNRIGG